MFDQSLLFARDVLANGVGRRMLRLTAFLALAGAAVMATLF